MNQILVVVNGGAAGQGVVTSDFMFANYSLAVAAPERTLTRRGNSDSVCQIQAGLSTTLGPRWTR